ncbi:hypothetical protein [Burkholderia pseudomallei]|nr:hypothetical protein [Burkholderia pseudomallei]
MTQRKPDSMRARRKKWLPPEVEYLRERYPHVKADLIARVLDMPAPAADA